MKKTTMMRIAATLLIAVLLTTCAIGATFAKYTAGINATSETLTVAEWKILIDSNEEFEDTVDFNFAETWTNTKPNEGAYEGTSVTNNLLAPGTSGSFDIKVTNASQVAAKFDIAFNFTNISALPLTYTYAINGTDCDADELETILAIGGEATVTVNWVWAFDGNTETDNALGTADVRDFTVSATITAEQVD